MFQMVHYAIQYENSEIRKGNKFANTFAKKHDLKKKAQRPHACR